MAPEGVNIVHTSRNAGLSFHLMLSRPQKSPHAPEGGGGAAPPRRIHEPTIGAEQPPCNTAHHRLPPRSTKSTHVRGGETMSSHHHPAPASTTNILQLTTPDHLRRPPRPSSSDKCRTSVEGDVIAAVSPHTLRHGGR
jgi:hypothetical protein